MEYNCKVIGPFGIYDDNNFFKSPLAESCGIYLWAVNVNGQYLSTILVKLDFRLDKDERTPNSIDGWQL